MKIQLKLLFMMALAVVIFPTLAATPAQGQAAQPNTIWRFMGIPQGFQRLRDVTANRRGNLPGTERQDPIKRIADPANLESDNPAIKAAAEIKKAEDEKKQKIKALKYLATIGCGCYDQDGKVTAALLDATKDCTPDVREAAVEAIKDAAGGECCRGCGSTSCCNEKITKRLSEMAYERDDSGCCVEPNADIRKAAARALKICCPGGPPRGPIEEYVEPAPELIPAPEGEDDPDSTTPDPDKPKPRPEPVPETGDDSREPIGESGSEDTDTDDALDPRGDNPLDADPAEALPPGRPQPDVSMRPMPLRTVGMPARRSAPVEMSLSDANLPSLPSRSPERTPATSFAAMLERGPDFNDATSRPASDWKPVEVHIPAPVRPAASRMPVSMPAPLPAQPQAQPIQLQPRTEPISAAMSQPFAGRQTAPVVVEIISVNSQNRDVVLESDEFDQVEVGTPFVITREYASGKTVIAQFVIERIMGDTAIARASEGSHLRLVYPGDKAFGHRSVR